MEYVENNFFPSALWKNGKNMIIGTSIVQFVIKIPKLVRMIFTIYRIQGYQYRTHYLLSRPTVFSFDSCCVFYSREARLMVTIIII